MNTGETNQGEAANHRTRRRTTKSKEEIQKTNKVKEIQKSQRELESLKK